MHTAAYVSNDSHSHGQQDSSHSLEGVLEISSKGEASVRSWQPKVSLIVT